jgi:aminoglycoside phosphotransferase (APT) family kinase protein
VPLLTSDHDIRLRLRDWLASKLPYLADLEITNYASPGAGKSAETILIDLQGLADGMPTMMNLVLRRQFEGMDYFLNSDLRWQYQVLQTMARFPKVPVPYVVGIEMDRAVLGAPFFVMQRVEGRVLLQRPNYNVSGWLVDLAPADRARLWVNNVKAIASVHSVPWQEGFAFMGTLDDGAPGLEQYLNHIARWLAWAADGRPQSTIDAALLWLQRNRPANAPVHVLWGDPIPANTLFGDDLEVTALLDWEMACLGPGEIDLAWFLMFDSFYSDYRGVERLAGLPDRSRIVDAYEAEAGRRIENLEYYEMLALVRFAIIFIRSAARFVADRPDMSFNAHTHNPITAEIARRLNLPVPEPGDDWTRLMAPPQ